MTIQNGVLVEAKQLLSPYFNQRPPQSAISLLVIHNISLPAGYFAGTNVQDLFCGDLKTEKHSSFICLKGLEVSAHLFIRRNAQVIQFVNFQQRAWHAGVSSYQGIENCNDYSIGIEMEGTDDCTFTNRQYKKLIKLTKALMISYPQITKERICGHSDIAPGRKTDPGPFFDWNKYKEQLS